MEVDPVSGAVVTQVSGQELPFQSVSKVVPFARHTLAVLASNPGGIYSFNTDTGETLRLVGDGINGVPTAGPASESSLYFPAGLAADASGDLFWTESEAIYERSAAGTLSLYAGQPFVSGAQDADKAAATFLEPMGLAVGSTGDLLVADLGNNAVRAISPETGDVSTVAKVDTPMAIAPGPGASLSRRSSTTTWWHAAGRRWSALTPWAHWIRSFTKGTEAFWTATGLPPNSIAPWGCRSYPLPATW